MKSLNPRGFGPGGFLSAVPTVFFLPNVTFMLFTSCYPLLLIQNGQLRHAQLGAAVGIKLDLLFLAERES